MAQGQAFDFTGLTRTPAPPKPTGSFDFTGVVKVVPPGRDIGLEPPPPTDDESAFRRWFTTVRRKHPDLDPDDPDYDYRAAFKAGVTGPDHTGHWPSEFKRDTHPNLVVGGFHTKTGARVPGTPRANEAELVRLGWDAATAKRLAGTPEPGATPPPPVPAPPLRPMWDVAQGEPPRPAGPPRVRADTALPASPLGPPAPPVAPPPALAPRQAAPSPVAAPAPPAAPPPPAVVASPVHPNDWPDIVARQEADLRKHGRFMEKGPAVRHRTESGRLRASERFLADYLARYDDDSVLIVDIGSGLGHPDPKVAGATVKDLQKNEAITKKANVVATDLASEIRPDLDPALDVAAIPADFKPPLNAIAAARGDRGTVVLRAANSIDLLMTADQTAEHFAHVATDLRDREVIYLFNRHVLRKPAGSTEFRTIADLREDGYAHNGRPWREAVADQDAYTLTQLGEGLSGLEGVRPVPSHAPGRPPPRPLLRSRTGQLYEPTPLGQGVVEQLPKVPSTVVQTVSGALRAVPTAIGETIFDQPLAGHKDEGTTLLERLKAHAKLVLTGRGGEVAPIGPVRAAVTPPDTTRPATLTEKQIAAAQGKPAPTVVPTTRAERFIEEVARRGLDIVAQLATDPAVVAAGGVKRAAGELLAVAFSVDGLTQAAQIAQDPDATPEDVAEGVLIAAAQTLPYAARRTRAAIRVAADKAREYSARVAADREAGGRITPEPTDILVRPDRTLIPETAPITGRPPEPPPPAAPTVEPPVPPAPPAPAPAAAERRAAPRAGRPVLTDQQRLALVSRLREAERIATAQGRTLTPAERVAVEERALEPVAAPSTADTLYRGMLERLKVGSLPDPGETQSISARIVKLAYDRGKIATVEDVKRFARMTPAQARAALTLGAKESRAELGIAPKPETPPKAPSPPGEHTFSSTQVNLPPALARPVLEMAAAIPEEDLAPEGRAGETPDRAPHVTVKYGLHTTDVDAVRKVLEGEAPITVTLGATSFFPNGESNAGDVLKVDVDSADLRRLNKKIADALETTDTHPTYKPHVTIAYLKPGLGEKYAGDDSLKGQTVTIDRITFTSKDGSVAEIQLIGRAKPDKRSQAGGLFTTALHDLTASMRGARDLATAADDAQRRSLEYQRDYGRKLFEQTARKFTPEERAQVLARAREIVEAEGRGSVPADYEEASRVEEGQLARGDQPQHPEGAPRREPADAGRGDRPGAGAALPVEGAPAAAPPEEAVGTPVPPKPPAEMTDEELADWILAQVEGAPSGRIIPETTELPPAVSAAPATTTPETTPERGLIRAGPAAPSVRLLRVDTVSGASAIVDSADATIGRKDVIVEEAVSGAHRIVKAGDQVTPTGRGRIAKGQYTAPEASSETSRRDISETAKPLGEVKTNDRGNLEVKFPERPADTVIAQLKAMGFRWAGRDKVWYAKETAARREAVERLIGAARGKPAVSVRKPQVSPTPPPPAPAAPAQRFTKGQKVEYQDYDGKWYETEVLEDTQPDGSTAIYHPTLRMQSALPVGPRGQWAGIGAPSRMKISAEPGKLRPVQAAPAAQSWQQAIKSGDQVVVEEGRGEVVHVSDDAVRVALEPRGTLTKWIPRSRVEAARHAERAAPKPGDRVVTADGARGTVEKIDSTGDIVVNLDEGTRQIAHPESVTATGESKGLAEGMGTPASPWADNETVAAYEYLLDEKRRMGQAAAMQAKKMRFGPSRRATLRTWQPDEEANLLEAAADVIDEVPAYLASVPRAQIADHLAGIDELLTLANNARAETPPADYDRRERDDHLALLTDERVEQLTALRARLEREVQQREGQQDFDFAGLAPTQPAAAAPRPPAEPADPELAELIEALKATVDEPVKVGEGPLTRAYFAGQDRVVAKVKIRQSPTSKAPDVPAGTIGRIQDYADGLLWVDFGDPYGTVAAEERELDVSGRVREDTKRLDYDRRPGTDRARSERDAAGALADAGDAARTAVSHAGGTDLGARGGAEGARPGPAATPPRVAEGPPGLRRGRLHGLGITPELSGATRLEIRGQRIRDIHDLASLAQIVRDQRIETQRFVYTRRLADGSHEVLGAEAVSSRLPDASAVFLATKALQRFTRTQRATHGEDVARWPAQVAAEYRRLVDEAAGRFRLAQRDRMQRLGADGYFLVHNHPSGNPTPSTDDVALTQGLAKRLPGFQGHVVIDSGRYAIIAADGAVRYVPIDNDVRLHAASVPHAVVGARILGPQSIYQIAAQVHQPGGVTLVFTSKAPQDALTMIVRAVETVPSHILKNPQTRGFLANRRTAYGAMSIAAYVDPADYDLARPFFDDGTFLDVVTAQRSATAERRTAAPTPAPPFAVHRVQEDDPARRRQQAVLMVQIIRRYLAVGLTFRAAARQFQADFGAGARAFDPHFELAWKTLRGETATVADALAEAHISGEEAPDVAQQERAPHGAGQLPERGEPAAGPAGDPGARPLGAVPPEPSAATAGAGPAGPRDRDQGGVVAPGVRDSARAGEKPVAAPAPDRGVVPGGALSPAGAAGDPGPRPADYGLTPERIATIIARGGVQRAKDNLAAIRTIKTILAERRHATPDEQEILAKYVGWGASDAAPYLAENSRYGWSANEKAIWQELRDLLTEEERDALRRSSPNAHFTFDLYRPIWSALVRAGFTGGKVLEPAVGVGHALGFMPPEVRAASTMTGVELEPLTAAIAQALYPSARVQAVGYEKARVARGTQDLVISNVPFGPFGVRDPHLKPFLTDRIHNYFFAKALEHVRPGGLVVFLTSRYTMDGQEATGVRRYLMEKADFVGAVRLPNTAFDKTAKTEVVTDLIVLQRKQEGVKPSIPPDLFIEAPLSERLSKVDVDWRGRKTERNVYRSAWYTEHPELVLGEESLGGTMYGGNEYTVTARGEDLQTALGEALAQILTKDTYQPASAQAAQAALQEMRQAYKAGEFKVGELTVAQGRVFKLDDDGQLVEVTPPRGGAFTASEVTRITGMIRVRNALRETVKAMRNPEATDAGIKKAQAALKKAYDGYVKVHGILNSAINKRLFLDDPEATNLLGLEVITPWATVVTDRKGKQTTRISYEVTGLADIFTKRTILAPPEITHVDTPKDALLASLGIHTRIDWPYMARIIGQDVFALQAALKAEGRVFEQPDGSWVLADEYLSGDVVSKLADAEAAAAEAPERFAGNVAALRAIQPRPKTAEEITIGLGAHWVDKDDLRQFAMDELGIGLSSIAVNVDAAEAYVRWTLTFSKPAEAAGEKHPLAVPYGPNQRYVYGFTSLLKDALNLQMPSLGWYEGSGDDRHYVKDPTGTLAARANLEELRAKWLQWTYEHPDVQARMVDIYNRRYNRTVKRTFDGSHLANFDAKGNRTAALPGLALPFPLFPHQLNAVWRMLASGNTLLAHEVGAGKTFEMIVAAMEMRRTGRARKPLITVPTYLLPQWRQAIIQAYPDAKVLAFEESDLEKKKRQQAMAKIAFGEWDIVLVPHSSFQLLKVSDRRMAEVLQRWVDQLMDLERAAAGAGRDDESVKRVETIRRKLEDKVAAKLDAANKSDDRALTWEQLGVDALSVDEAHLFKNLFYFSKLENLRGLSRSESDRALDLFVKVIDINEGSNYRNLVLATATPIMNSMAELFTMQRYLQPRRLEEQGFENFDNWYATFGHALPTTEQRPDGTYQEVMRLRAFSNLDLLYRTMAEVMDYVGWEDMPYLKLPKLAGGRIEVVQTEPHPMYETLRTWFADRLANLRDTPPHMKYHRDGTKEYIAPPRPDPLTGEPIPGKKDNILTVMTDAKLAAVDVRLVLGEHAKDVPTSRLQIAAKDIAAIYKREAKKKGVILVFLDVGTPQTTAPLEFLAAAPVEDTTGGAALGVEEEVSDADVVAEADNANGVFNLYDALKAALVKRGIPSREIAYIHQARNAAERLALFQAANEGRVRVVLASTDKGGMGMNIQTRLAAEIELDAPRAQRPGDIRQRHGRILRQGNTYDEVEIRRYVTQGTTDEWLYGLLAQKSTLITSFMRGNLTEFKDDDPSTMSIEEAQVRATGDPRGIELTELRASVNRLKAQADAAERAIASARADIARATESRRWAEGKLSEVKRWLAASYVPLKGDAFRMEVAGTAYTDRGEANAALLTALEQVYQTRNVDGAIVGKVGGLSLIGTWDKLDKTVDLDLDRAPLGHGTTKLAAIPPSDAGVAFGAGRNVVTSVTNKYADLPDVATGYERTMAQAAETIAAAERLIAKPSDALARLKAAQGRIAALEDELRAEGAAKDAALKAEREQQKAEAAERAKKLTAPSGDASVGAFAPTPPTAGTITSIQPVQFPELVALARELARTPGVVRRFRKPEKAGEFGAGLIRLHSGLFARGNEQQLAATLAHEIGHLIDWLPDYSLKRGNLLGHLFSLHSFLKGKFTAPDGKTITNKTIKAELTKLSDTWRPWDLDAVTAGFAAYRHSAKELYADAISVLLNNPGLLEAEAPTFYEQFFAALDEKPDVKRAYFTLQEVLAGTPEELVARRRAGVREMFALGDTKAMELERLRQAEQRRGLRWVWDHLRIDLVDKNTPVIDRVKALRRRGVRVNQDDDPRYLLEERNYLGGKLHAFTARHFQPVYEQMITGGIDWSTFGEALLYERIIAGDRSELANPRGLSPDVAQGLYDDLKRALDPEQRRELDVAIRDFRGAVRIVAGRAHRAGLISDEMDADMRANPAYATFRVIEHLEDAVTSRVYRQIGTLKDITNPADATMLKTLVTLRAIEHQRVKTKTFEFLTRHYPQDIEQAKEVWTGKGLRPVEPKDRKLELVTYYEQGRLRGKYVDPVIADSLTNASVGQNNAVIVGLRWLNSHWFRPVYTTLNVGFQTFNLGRDFLRFWKNTPEMTLKRAGQLYWQAIPLARVRAFGLPEATDATRRAAYEHFLEAEDAGIFALTFNDTVRGRDIADTQIEETLARMGIGDYATNRQSVFRRTPVFRELVRLLDAIEAAGNFIETIPKAAGIYHYAGPGSIANLTPEQRSFVRRKIGSPDFLAGGTYKPITNELFLFSNAFTQAVRADLEVARDPETRSGFWWKTVKLNILPKLAIYGMLAALAAALARDEDDEDGWLDYVRKAFAGISEYDLTNYLSIPLGVDEKGQSVYVRIPQDDFGRLVGGLTWKLLRAASGEKNVLEAAMQVGDYTAGQLPSPAPSLQVGADLLAMAAGANVYDPFRTRFLFTEDELKARDWRQIQKFVGYEFQQIGGGIVWKFYAGEQRPRDLTTPQQILDFPIISNIVGRWIKISSFGEVERLREAQGAVQRTEARQRLDEREAVNDAIRAYHRLAPPDRTEDKVHDLAQGVVASLPIEPEARVETYKRVVKKLKMGAARGEQDPLTDVVLASTSNDQKVQVILKAAKTRSGADMRHWIDRARYAGVISPEVANEIRRALEPAQVP